METINQLIKDSIIQADTPRYLPEGSSRQVVKQELFKRAYQQLSDRFTNGRSEKRSLARSIANDLYRRGERLLAPEVI